MRKRISPELEDKIATLRGKHSVDQIAKMCGVCGSTVRNVFERYDEKKAVPVPTCINLSSMIRPLTKQELMGGRASPYIK